MPHIGAAAGEQPATDAVYANITIGDDINRHRERGTHG
jgi:hypothetical protein